jgi:hypothetical protein
MNFEHCTYYYLDLKLNNNIGANIRQMQLIGRIGWLTPENVITNTLLESCRLNHDQLIVVNVDLNIKTLLLNRGTPI